MQLDSLYRDYTQRYVEFGRSKKKLAHYTSSENSLNILRGQSLWLKSAEDLADKYELEYGKQLVRNFQRSKNELVKKLSSLSSINFEVLLTFGNEQYWFEVFTKTFIASFVEHSPDDDIDGRVDMWERYAKPDGVAFILKPSFLDGSDNFTGLYPLPVRYFNQTQLDKFLSEIADDLFSIPASQSLKRHQYEIAFQLVCLIASIKKPAYRTETEWRLIANTFIDNLSEPLSFNNFPKRLELDLSTNSISKYNLTNSLDKIIIGPGKNQSLHFKRIEQILKSLNLENVNINLSTL